MPTEPQIIAAERQALMGLLAEIPLRWIPSLEFKFSGKFGVIPFGKVLYQEPGQPPNAARAEVSDHLPLWAEFRVTELEHELNQILNRQR